MATDQLSHTVSKYIYCASADVTNRVSALHVNRIFSELNTKHKTQAVDANTLQR